MHVITTAGHVDHGKSTLIERITGIDPDRLAEEKARGLTIDLGFAWLTLPSGREVGIVDVPGHERFIHNMLAGAGNVDSAILVVAANEGWKPQTEEHLQILDLLGARRAVVALTKIDAQPDVARALADVFERLARTSLEDAPIIPVSATTGEGIDALIAAIDAMLGAEEEQTDRARPRVFVDRSFSIHGSGTVVTGTLTGGTLRIGDEVAILPCGVHARIRGIQTHKVSREQAEAVSRVALNLAGVDRGSIVRGDAVVLAGDWRPTRTVDVSLRTVRALDHPVSARSAYKVYVGSAEVDARIALYEVRALGASEACFARIVLAEPIVAAPFDRFVLRDVGRHATVAGGTILDAHPLPGERSIEELRARASATPDGIASLVVAERGVVARAELPVIAGTAAEPSAAIPLRSFVVSKDRFDTLTDSIERALAEFHAREPLASGIPIDDARALAGVDDPRLFAEILDSMSDRVVQEGPSIRLASHRVSLSAEHEAARAAILSELDAAAFAPPPLTALRARHGEKLVRALIDAAELVKVSDDLVFSRDALQKAKRAIATVIAGEGPLTAARIKDVLGTTRKFAIPLLEYLDATGFTRRRGDLRELA